MSVGGNKIQNAKSVLPKKVGRSFFLPPDKVRWFIVGEVTIDSIQIEIESNSTNASKGLDALAGSLEKLKKNGSFKTESKNLNQIKCSS